MNIKQDKGFTLLEVMAVIIIIGVMSVILIPKLSSSTINARQKADIATAHQVKAALDRYQVENGVYLKTGELTLAAVDGTDDGTVVSEKLIPKYISKLDKSTTQQNVDDANKGFGVGSLELDYSIPEPASSATNIIIIYLSTDGLAAEVRAYDDTLAEVLWTSAN